MGAEKEDRTKDALGKILDDSVKTRTVHYYECRYCGAGSSNEHKLIWAWKPLEHIGNCPIKPIMELFYEMSKGAH